MNSIKNDSQTQSAQPADEKGYNGWSNYETWVVNLWLTNDSNDYDFFKDLVDQHDSVSDASNALKECIEEINPLADRASMFSDLLRASLREVDWYEIVTHFLDE